MPVWRVVWWCRRRRQIAVRSGKGARVWPRGRLQLRRYALCTGPFRRVGRLVDVAVVAEEQPRLWRLDHHAGVGEWGRGGPKWWVRGG